MHAPAALVLGVAMVLSSSPSAAAEAVQLYAAGSLKAAMTDIASAFEAAGYGRVDTTFGPSGLLRQRIADGEPADVFASANMRHPKALAEQGMGGPVVMFARNQLCALAQPDLRLSTSNLLDRLLDPEVRVGTSTPKADPSGDYAWVLFERAEEVRPGSFETLSGKALQLTGGPDSPEPPADRHKYAWVMTEDRADVFLTYCTNAVLARRDTPALQVVEVPAALSVGADYGLSLLAADKPAAARFALFVLSANAQSILADYGFRSLAKP